MTEKDSLLRLLEARCICFETDLECEEVSVNNIYVSANSVGLTCYGDVGVLFLFDKYGKYVTMEVVE